MRDEEDRQLEALFRLPEVPDDGFAERVSRRIRRRVWVRRWSLPIAAAIGALVAARPAIDLLSLLPVVAELVPQEFRVLPPDLLDQLPALCSALLLAGGMTLAVRFIGD